MTTNEIKTVSATQGKSTYEMPTVEIIILTSEDVIMTSNGFEGDDDPIDE